MDKGIKIHLLLPILCSVLYEPVLDLSMLGIYMSSMNHNDKRREENNLEHLDETPMMC